MTDEQLQKYYAERKAILKEYNSKAARQAGLILLVGILVMAAVASVCIFVFDYGPLALVLCLILGLFVIMTSWMKVLVINRAKEKKLQEFEDRSLLIDF